MTDHLHTFVIALKDNLLASTLVLITRNMTCFISRQRECDQDNGRYMVQSLKIVAQ